MEIEQIHPELRESYKRTPRIPMHSRAVLMIMRALMRVIPAPKAGSDVAIETRKLQSAGIRIYTAEGALSGAALLWIHGGGLVIGRPEQNDQICGAIARDLKLVVVSVKYRLAPDHPWPGAIDDCFEAWRWLQRSARELGIDATRIAVSGQSAGGGLAACLAQRILDAQGVQPAAQVLFCPMLDDRTSTRQQLDMTDYFLWNNRSNRAAWTWYLGQPAGGTELPPYASAARRKNLAGLPPAWISVGELELFYDEVCHYAERLKSAGVPCHLHIVPRAPHAVESLAPDAPLVRQLWSSAYEFLADSLGAALPKPSHFGRQDHASEAAK